MERIKKSPHYKDGEFRNLHSTMMMTSQKGRLGAFWGFLFKQETDLRPEKEIPVIKTDLSKISKDENVLVWFGHSSYFIQIDGKRILVDPRILWGFSGFVCKQAVQGGGCLQACRLCRRLTIW